MVRNMMEDSRTRGEEVKGGLHSSGYQNHHFCCVTKDARELELGHVADPDLTWREKWLS